MTTVLSSQNKQEKSENNLESIRRFSTYQQLLEAYQFVNCHPNMASLLILCGIACQVPCVIYYSCYYMSFMINIYCTIMPALYTLFNFKDLNMKYFRPPHYNFLFCVLNIVGCYMSLISAVLCFYLLLPIKGRYLATIQKQFERRKHYCVILAILLTVSIPYQVALSMLRSIRCLQGDMEESHMQLLSYEKIRWMIFRQGENSFWNLHAYQNIPCCFGNFSSSAANSASPSPECCQSFGRSEPATKMCTESADRSLLWPDCAAAIVNIASDVEITMDAQMQLSLLLACVTLVIVKCSLSRHLNMTCVQCQHTYGWLGMKRYDN